MILIIDFVSGFNYKQSINSITSYFLSFTPCVYQFVNVTIPQVSGFPEKGFNFKITVFIQNKKQKGSGGRRGNKERKQGKRKVEERE
jgi:hypothetical protein